MTCLRVRLKGKEADIVGKYVLETSREAKVQSFRDDLLGDLESLPQYSVASAALSNPIFVVEVDGHVCEVCNLEVCNLVIIDVVLIDLLGDNEEPNEVLLFEHDLHLVENELQLFTFVHRSVGLHLHFLQNVGGLKDIIIVFFVLHDHQHASCVFHLHHTLCTSRKIFLAQTSRTV